MVADLSTIVLPGRPAAFGELLLGPENRLLLGIPELLAERCDGQLVVIYGPHGVGKTHLVQGLVANELEAYPNQRAVYTTGVDYARGYAHACQSDAMDEFTRQYRSCRLLAIDTVCELAGKAAAQAHFARTLEIITAAGGTVLATLRGCPDKRQCLIDPLGSRLLGGWSVSVAAPTEPTRLSIVHYMAARRGLRLDETAATRLAARVHDVGQLTSAIAQLASSSSKQITASDVATYLETQRNAAASPSPSVDSIAKLAAQHSGLTLKELRGPSRRTSHVLARGVAMLVARRITGRSYSRIGAYFGGRDHSTVMHACRRTEKQAEHDDELAALCNRVFDIVNEQCNEAGAALGTSC